MRQSKLAAYRRRGIPSAERRVLDTGVGSGLNLLFYSDRADCVIGLDPSPCLLAKALGRRTFRSRCLKVGQSHCLWKTGASTPTWGLGRCAHPLRTEEQRV